MNVRIIFSNGTEIPVELSDIQALIAAGLLEVVEKTEEGLPFKVLVTEAGFSYVDELSREN